MTKNEKNGYTYTKNGWKYVEMFDFPVKSSEISPLINIDNFQDVHMYGWVK